MQSWLGQKLIAYVMERTRQGDVRATLLLDHPQVQLTFPRQRSPPPSPFAVRSAASPVA